MWLLPCEVKIIGNKEKNNATEIWKTNLSQAKTKSILFFCCSLFKNELEIFNNDH